MPSNIMNMKKLLLQLVDNLIQIFRYIVERLLKPVWLLIFLLIYLVFINWISISNIFSKFGIPEYTLIKEYLSVFISWPVTVLIIASILFFKFSKSIVIFLENSKLSQAGPLGVESRQENTAPVEQNTSNNGDSETRILEEKKERFEFLYLNLVLVLNTKYALLWFNFQPSLSSTKESFISIYQLPPVIINPIIEKEAILNALLTSQLLESNGNILKLTEKGKRFLKFIGYITDSQ